MRRCLEQMNAYHVVQSSYKERENDSKLHQDTVRPHWPTQKDITKHDVFDIHVRIKCNAPLLSEKTVISKDFMKVCL